MNNKIQIQKLKDNAELAWAAYGYFHLADSHYKPHKQDKDGKRLEHFRELKAKELGRDLDENTYPTYTDILNVEHKYFKDKKTGKLKDGLLDDKLFGGDFTPTQAKRFFEKYDILIHQPNTESGFSATLFGEKRKQTNTESKEVSYTNDYGYTNYILSIRSTESKLNFKHKIA